MQHEYISCNFLKFDRTENRVVNLYIIPLYNTFIPWEKTRNPIKMKKIAPRAGWYALFHVHPICLYDSITFSLYTCHSDKKSTRC